MRLFLSSSFATVAGLFDKVTNGACRGKTVTFIPTASLHEEVNFYVGAAKEAMASLGLTVDELEISTASREEITRKLEAGDCVYISGGNTFFLLQELARTGAGEILVEQVKAGKSYIGESAGAVILAENIEYIAAMDDPAKAPGPRSFAALGLIDFYPVPHWGSPYFKEATGSIVSNYSDRLNLVPFSNAQAIVVNDGAFEVLDSA